MYKPNDFEILRGDDTGDKRIAYVFNSKDNKITANFFFTPKDVQTRGLIWKNGEITECFHIGYPFANYDGMSKLPKAEEILRTIINRLQIPDLEKHLQ